MDESTYSIIFTGTELDVCKQATEAYGEAELKAKAFRNGFLVELDFDQVVGLIDSLRYYKRLSITGRVFTTAQIDSTVATLTIFTR